MFSTVPNRYTVRIVANGNSGARYELFDTQASRSVKSYRSHALAVSDMEFLNTLLAPTQPRPPGAPIPLRRKDRTLSECGSRSRS